ncbi:alpha/beta fold hydrolase [Allorhizocola rhizosphaerae]|uniref:alpha/beta fold hydrolase n=1 Tax=Allorhizocola rhizosphaerae TaxID=1872709 RepID=UPI0013C2AF2D|nr:alpha/beta hydrolase [Allorhizocola rhizosphaerae]
MKSRWGAALCAALMMATLTASPGQAGGPSLVDRHECAGMTGFTCAFLPVPLDRSGRGGETLRLQVAFETDATAPRGTLLVLTGGPGQPGVSFVPRISQRLAYLLADYRLVMIDQRGTGAGAIDCPQLQREVGSSDVRPPSAAAIAECAAIFGETRHFYTTHDTVKDLDELRAALGVRRWTLDGVSYGAFVAAQYGLTYPWRVERLVLDSVVPKEGIYTLYADSFHRVEFVLREACREQGCDWDPAVYLERALQAGLNAVDFFDFIIIASIVDPKLTGQTYFPVLRLLRQAGEGDLAPMRTAIERLHSNFTPASEFSSGLHIATICADLVDAPWGDSSAPLAGREQALARAVGKLSPAYVWPFPTSAAGEQAIASVCGQWPPSRPSPRPPFKKLTMPVLLLNGDRDLSTPDKWARDLAACTPRARLVIVPGMGHSMQGRNAEADAAVQEFLLR